MDVDTLMYTVMQEKLLELTALIQHDLPQCRLADATERAEVLYRIALSTQILLTATDTLYDAAVEEAETMGTVRHISEKAVSSRNKSPKREGVL